MEAIRKSRKLIGIGLAVVFCSAVVSATSGTGSISQVISPPATYEPFKIKRETPDGWSVKVEAKDGLKIATQMVTFADGGTSGWHSHPGPVFITVKQGTMTFYDVNCNATVITAGNGFLDGGADPHFARNESGAPAITVVTYFVPPSATSLKKDEPQPPTCWVH